MDLRDFLFRKRSYTPIPLALVILYFAGMEKNFWLPGIPLILLGEWVRLASVRYAGGRIRTRKVGAKLLCTTGPFARVRNPIYLGNIMIYSGSVLLAGGKQVWVMLVVTLLFFVVQYGLIISLEEETLGRLFGDEYDEYIKSVPRIIPGLKRWRGAGKKVSPASWSQAVKREKRTLQTIAIFLVVLAIRVQLVP
ncbi:MAG: isoprenylcysteine carboxylmethyltransferase family protein [Candidatus Neomarinimicrobiota bacterium]